MKVEDFRKQRSRRMAEEELQAQIIELAKRLGWFAYHTRDSRRSEPGYPDLHLVHPVAKRSMFRELKTERGRLSPDQVKWLDALRNAGWDAEVWRPADLIEGRVAEELSVRRR